MPLPDGKTVVDWLASTRLSLYLFGLLALTAIPGTLAATENWSYYRHPLYQLLLAAFGLHLLFCTLKRYRSLAPSTLMVHAGVLVTLAGAILTATGYVATVNIYEGESTDVVYRWDQHRDVPFGATLKIVKIHRQFYPVPLKIGVLKGEEKHRLVTSSSGEQFDLEGYTVRIEPFDPWEEVVRLTVMKGGTVIGTTDTSDEPPPLPAGLPYRFKLVAFQDAAIKRYWVDLQLLQQGKVVASGVTEVNSPYSWQGLDFFSTSISLDPERRPYAGIQVVRDPGTYVVYTGMFILSLGTIWAWYRRFRP
jgi:hypothetical protein